MCTKRTRTVRGMTRLVAATCGFLCWPIEAVWAEAPAAAADAPARDEFFDVTEIRVLGNTVLPVMEVERAVYAATGPHRSIKDVQAARAALEQAYHSAGYGTVFVDIPEQDVGNGIVRLHATEGRLDRVRVTGARYFSERKILAAVPAAQAGQVPQLPELQSQLSAVNAQTADRTVTPILKAGRTPGTVDLELRVNDRLPLHGGVTLNNRYTPETTHLRAIVDLAYGDLFQDFQSAAFEYQTAPERPEDVKVYSLSYVAPLGASGNLLALFAVDNNSNVAAVGTLGLLGVGQVYGVHLIHPFAPFGLFSQSVNFGGDYKHFTQTVNVPEQPSDKTPISYINWSVVYALADHTPRHDTIANLGLNFGVRGVANDPAEFDYKRFGAQPGYYYLRGGFEQRQALFGGMSVDARVGFQLTDGPLISNEQMGMGGIDTVRGYPESIVLGDSGVNGTLELRSPTWGFFRDPTVNHFLLFVFYDAGYVSILDALPDQQSRYELASFGGGLRLVAFRGLDAYVEWADPLKTVSTVERGQSRVEFQVHYGF